MCVKELIAKRALYEAKKVELSLNSYEEEILSAVNDFRAKKEQEIQEYESSMRQTFEAQKLADEKKLDNYLELLDELIKDANERAAQEAAQQEQSDETIV